MQTFLPYEDFEKTAKVLDYKRLGKQRVEALQILNAMYDQGNSWHRHVAVRMWRGHQRLLAMYANIIIHEWCQRGYCNNMGYFEIKGPIAIPSWLWDERLHLSHRCNLVRKEPEIYKPIWPKVDPKAPYWWPVKLLNEKKQQEMIEYWGK